MGKGVTVYSVRDADGRLVKTHRRVETPDGKKIWWESPDGKSGLNGTKLADLPLYGAQLVRDWAADDLIILTEGEKARDALDGVGLPALGTVTGASATPGEEALKVLRGRRVCLWPDNDEPGRKHMQRIAERLQSVACEVLIYTWYEAPEKGDAADHPVVQSRDPGAVDRLLTDLEGAPRWKPAGPPSGLLTLTADELMALELPPVRWVVPDILPEGVTILAGKPKLGKSWMALGLTVAVANGGVALGVKPVEQGDCLYLALEDNHRRLQRRLRKVLNGAEPPQRLHIVTEFPRMDDGGTEALEGWLEEHPDARLVVVDILKKVRPRVSGNRSLYDTDYEALEILQPLAGRYGVGILVVHHLRKEGASDPLDEISGSTGLSGGADGVLVLRRDRGGADAYLHVDGRDVEEPAELALTWNPNTALWTLAGDAEQYRLSQTRAEIIGVLEKSGEPMTPTEVADAVGKSFNTVKQRLWQMSREGQVLVSDGRYSLPHNPHNRNLEKPVTAVTQVTVPPEEVGLV